MVIIYGLLDRNMARMCQECRNVKELILRTYLHSGYVAGGYAFMAYHLHTVDVKRQEYDFFYLLEF